MVAVVADGVGDIESEIVAAFLGGDAQDLAVLWGAEVFFKIDMEG